jgi:hypothetical protein
MAAGLSNTIKCIYDDGRVDISASPLNPKEYDAYCKRFYGRLDMESKIDPYMTIEEFKTQVGFVLPNDCYDLKTFDTTKGLVILLYYNNNRFDNVKIPSSELIAKAIKHNGVFTKYRESVGWAVGRIEYARRITSSIKLMQFDIKIEGDIIPLLKSIININGSSDTRFDNDLNYCDIWIFSMDRDIKMEPIMRLPYDSEDEE